MRKFLSPVAVIAAIAGMTVIQAPPASAAPMQWHPSAITGATFIKALGGVVTSDLTATSGTSGGGDRTSSNSSAAGTVDHLITAGAAATKTTSSLQSTGDVTVTSSARIAGVNVLDGLITVGAVETNVTTVGKPDGTTSATGNSQLTDIRIAGVTVPTTIPKNFVVNVPGVAAVTLNAFQLQHPAGGTSSTIAWAMSVQLLESRGGFDAGTTVMLNPLHHSLAEAHDGMPSLSGYAYSTRVKTKVGDNVNVASDPTAIVYTPFAGSNGQTLTNGAASVSIPQVLGTGAVKSTSTSTTANTGAADIRNTNEVTNLNLLGGLITADAIEVTAVGTRSDGVWKHSEQMKLVNLVVAGQKIPVDVGPNTSIDVAGLGKVEINARGVSSDAMFNAIVGVRITVDTARAGLPAGATIELATAATQMSL
jgi:hypothetical protein